MALISIKRYLDLSSGDAYKRILELLAEIVTERAIGIERSACERFKNEVSKIQRPKH